MREEEKRTTEAQRTQKEEHREEEERRGRSAPMRIERQAEFMAPFGGFRAMLESCG
jgi:hypothetical protein